MATINLGGACERAVADLTDEQCERIVEREATGMDDAIREAVHGDLAPCSARAFLAAYCERHAAEYGEPWAVA